MPVVQMKSINWTLVNAPATFITPDGKKGANRTVTRVSCCLRLGREFNFCIQLQSPLLPPFHCWMPFRYNQKASEDPTNSLSHDNKKPHQGPQRTMLIPVTKMEGMTPSTFNRTVNKKLSGMAHKPREEKNSSIVCAKKSPQIEAIK